MINPTKLFNSYLHEDEWSFKKDMISGLVMTSRKSKTDKSQRAPGKSHRYVIFS